MANRWLLRIVTLMVWALACLSITFWVLKFAGSAQGPVTGATVATTAPGGPPGDLARVFGPPVSAASAPKPGVVLPPVVDPATRFALLGVVADRGKTGVALIAVEGKPARPYRVGTQVDADYTLKSVAIRSATLAPSSKDGAAFTLQLAPSGGAAPAPPPVAGSPAPMVPASGVNTPQQADGIPVRPRQGPRLPQS